MYPSVSVVFPLHIDKVYLQSAVHFSNLRIYVLILTNNSQLCCKTLVSCGSSLNNCLEAHTLRIIKSIEFNDILCRLSTLSMPLNDIRAVIKTALYTNRKK